MIWLNGQLLDDATARIDPLDRGLLLGDGLFETMIARHGKVVLFEPHMQRLSHGATLLGIKLPFSTQGLGHACEDLLEAAALLKAERVAMRLTLTRGPGPRGLSLPDTSHPTVLITAAQATLPPHSVSLATSSIRRNSYSPAARIKALPYLDNVLAKEEARKLGAGDALMLDSDGHVASTAMANIFFWEGERLVTPSLAGPVLPGITRATVLECARSMKINVAEESASPERLIRAQGLFITNSLMGLVPVTQLDRHVLADNPATATLAAAYEKHITGGGGR